jgi:hypothetical protein
LGMKELSDATCQLRVCLDPSWFLDMVSKN